MCNYIRICFVVLLCTLTLGVSTSYASDLDAETTVQKESEVRVKIINPKDSELSNDKEKMIPKTGSVTSNKFFLSGLLLVLSGVCLIKNKKRKKEQDL